MNLAYYEQTGQTLYSDFAAIIKFVLEKAISATTNPLPQSIQCRCGPQK